MDEITNSDRACWARIALDAFQCETRSDDETAVQDLLCDLMHFCDETNQDFDSLLKNARGMHEVEKREDG